MCVCACGLMQDRRDQKAHNNERKRDRADPHTSKGKVVVGWIGCCAVHSVRATKKARVMQSSSREFDNK